jgi:hypothetical protein
MTQARPVDPVAPAATPEPMATSHITSVRRRVAVAPIRRTMAPPPNPPTIAARIASPRRFLDDPRSIPNPSMT